MIAGDDAVLGDEVEQVRHLLEIGRSVWIDYLHNSDLRRCPFPFACCSGLPIDCTLFQSCGLLPCLLIEKPPLELAAERVRMLATALTQIILDAFVGLALPSLHDRVEKLPPERSLATFPCRGEKRVRKCLQCHGDLLVSR